MRTLLTLLTLTALPVLTSSAFAADDAVQQAVKRLSESGSYEWRTDLHLPSGPQKATFVEGRYNFTQGVHLKLALDDKTLEVAARDGVIVATVGDGWKPAKKFTRSDPVHSALRGLIDFTLPHRTLEDIVGRWRNVKEQNDGSFLGVADLKSAGEALANTLKQGLQISGVKNAGLKASVWLETGLPRKCLFEFDASKGGSLLRSQSIKIVSLTTLTNIGSTTVLFPPEAEAALQAAKP